jgi:hypothetical protein
MLLAKKPYNGKKEDIQNFIPTRFKALALGREKQARWRDVWSPQSTEALVGLGRIPFRDRFFCK